MTSPAAKHTFTVYGYVKPRFHSGSYPVKAYFYKKQSNGTYLYVKSLSLKASNYSTYSKVSHSTSLTSKGDYRVAIVFAGSPKSDKGYSFAATRSPYLYFKVK